MKFAARVCFSLCILFFWTYTAEYLYFSLEKRGFRWRLMVNIYIDHKFNQKSTLLQFIAHHFYYGNTLVSSFRKVFICHIFVLLASSFLLSSHGLHFFTFGHHLKRENTNYYNMCNKNIFSCLRAENEGNF